MILLKLQFIFFLLFLINNNKWMVLPSRKDYFYSIVYSDNCLHIKYIHNYFSFIT